jgi:hypothetical protein
MQIDSRSGSISQQRTIDRPCSSLLDVGTIDQTAKQHQQDRHLGTWTLSQIDISDFVSVGIDLWISPAHV